MRRGRPALAGLLTDRESSHALVDSSVVWREQRYTVPRYVASYRTGGRKSMSFGSIRKSSVVHETRERQKSKRARLGG